MIACNGRHPAVCVLNAFRLLLTRDLFPPTLKLNAFNFNGAVRKVRQGMYIVGSYLIYLALSLAVTVLVAHSLKRNGRVFLIEAFHGNVEVADSVNHLLLAGFYLVNIGYVTLELRTEGLIPGLREAIELVCAKIGPVLLVLGGMHFGNLYVFHRLRQRGRERPAGRGEAGGWLEDPHGKVLE